MKNQVSDKVFYPKLSFEVVGCLFETHNHLGRFAKEKQYGDFLEKLFSSRNIKFDREKDFKFDEINKAFTNRVDFDINGEMLLELKAKIAITKDDYNQINRYLEVGNRKLAIIVNFRNKYLKPIRIIRSYS